MGTRHFGHATLAYTTCFILVLSYEISFYGHQLPSALFWIPIAGAISIVAWQSFVVDGRRARVMVVLTEIVAVGVLAHMLFVIPAGAGVVGRDMFADLNATLYDQKYGWPLPLSVPTTTITRTVSEWPLLHFLGIATSELLGVELFSVSNPNNILRWFPTAISAGTPLFWYAIAKRIYRREDVGLLASLGSSLLFYNVMFHAWYVRETLGYLLLFAFILAYVIGASKIEQNLRMRLIAILLLVALLFAHHLSFLFALLFLALAFLLPGLVNRVLYPASDRSNPNHSEVRLPAGVLFLTGLIMFLSYLIYIGQPIFGLLVDSAQALFEPTVAIIVRSSGGPFSRDRILLASRVAFGVIFTGILTRKLLQKERTLVWDAIGFAWGAVTGLGVVVTYVVANVVNAGILRLEAFGWPLVLIPASHVASERRKRASGLVLIVAFAILNLAVVPPYIYDSTASPDYRAGETSMRYSLGLYKAADWFEGDGTIVGDVSTFELFGDLRQGRVVTDFQIFEGNLTDISRYQWIVLRQENANVVVSVSGVQQIGRLTPQTSNVMNSSSLLSRVYDNGDVWIYEVAQP